MGELRPVIRSSARRRRDTLKSGSDGNPELTSAADFLEATGVTFGATKTGEYGDRTERSKACRPPTHDESSPSFHDVPIVPRREQRLQRQSGPKGCWSPA